MTSQTRFVWLHLDGEVPRLGSGRRRVEIVRLGWKWVKVRKPSQDHTIRIKRNTWDNLKQVTL